MIPLPPPDARLPGISAALDGGRIAAQLAGAWDAAVRLFDCRPCYARYKPGTSCVVLYAARGLAQDARSPGAPVFHVKLYADGRDAAVAARPSLARRAARAVERHPDLPAPPVLHRPDLGAIAYAFPFDPALPGLVKAAAEHRMRRRLAAFAGIADRPRPEIRIEILRYKPGRKALLRYRVVGAGGGAPAPGGEGRVTVPGGEGHATVLYGKLHADDRGSAIARWTEALAATGVPVAPVAAWDGGLRLLLHPAATGTRWADEVADGTSTRGSGTPTRGSGHAVAAEALAALHRAPPATLEGAEAIDLARAVDAAGRAVGSLVPALAGDADRLARRIVDRIAAASGPPAPVHGDFYDDQVLIDAQGAVLIDLDEAGIGHPLVDVGNALAHFSARGSAGALEARAAFLDAYARRMPADTGTAAAFEAAALLRLAPGPFRRLEPDWPDRVAALVALAGARLGAARVPAATRVPGASPALGATPVPGATPIPGAAVAEAERPARPSGVGPPDPALPQLELALVPKAAADAFGRLFPDARIRVDRAVVVRHKPGRRCVIRYDVRVAEPGGWRPRRWYGKTFASRRGARVLDVHGAVFDGIGPRVRTPQPLGYWAEADVALMSAVPGDPIAAALAGDDRELTVRLAAALHAWHASEANLPRRHDLAAELAPLPKRVEALAALSPNLAERARACLDAALAGPGRPPNWRHRPIHRDFYPDQVLADAGGALAILDFDDAAMGEPAVDVANFVAHVRLDRCRAPRGDDTNLAAVARWFVDAYRVLDPMLDGHLVRYLEGTTLLRLAAIHRPRAGGERLAAALVAASAACLGVGLVEGAML